ncbi:MAG: AgmX/PglI C-terminal domain-containing protein [Deltaproteobacteria bacterium]|nr:AgmX/PglI C-terminal domain-containing protein [Deltaproteobacteria bacterium]
MDSAKLLRAVLILRGVVVEDRLFARPEAVTLAPSTAATFLTPPIGLPERMPFMEPAATGYDLTLTSAMGGTLTLDGTEAQVRNVYAARAAEDMGGGLRRVPVRVGDHGLVSLDESGDLTLFFQFVTPPEKLGRARDLDPFFLQALLLAFLLVGGTVATSLVFAPESFASELEVRPERVARYIVKKPVEQKKTKVSTDEAALARRLAETARPLPVVVRSREPMTERQRLEAKVAKRGVLAAMDQLTKRDSAMRQLFNRDTAGELSRSMNSIMDDARARAAAEAGGGGGAGPGAESTRGTSLGGGGTGVAFGQTHGGGRIDTGGAGGVQATLKGAKERRVQVGVATGDPSVSDGLSRDIVQRVVRAHQGGIKYCYETELMRQPKLGGKVVVSWRIDLEGKVQNARIRTTSMNNTAVEACLVRQIGRWRFPKPAGTMVDVSYPFLFRSGL